MARYHPYRYVIARYFYRTYGADQDHDDVGHEVFALGAGAGGSWEPTQDPPHAVGVQRPICTRRAFYWHADEPEPRLMRFGLRDRAFAVARHPPTGWNPADDMLDLEDGSKLCYVHATAEASFYDEMRWSALPHRPRRPAASRFPCGWTFGLPGGVTPLARMPRGKANCNGFL
jgi:hypothetical protein